ncbi:hypothetical protein MMC28_008249 [Mycoblastus sanguinarius]|nr:hypothetical protein [Mycoblastus sanguinarius]
MQEFLKRLTLDDQAQKTDKILKSWREEHRRSLQDLFDRVDDQAFFKPISNLVNQWSKDSRLLSVEQNKFQFNICLFVEAKTGRKGLEYREAIQILREMSFVKNEQSKILYKAIEDQRTEIALQQQIITCLEYRHVLESLPQKDFPIMTALAGTNSGTGAWQKTWRLAVEYELDKMLVDYIKPPPPAIAPAKSTITAPPAAGTLGTGATSSTSATLSANSTTSLTPSKSPPSLRALLQSDFDGWAKGSKQLNNDKNAKIVPTAMPAVPGAAPNMAGGPAGAASTPSAPRTKRPKGAPPLPGTWTTGNFILVESYKPDYETWPSFQTGYNLYGELSANIHTYGKSYDIHEINFTKSHRIILQWLNPKVGPISDPKAEKVNWEEV